MDFQERNKMIRRRCFAVIAVLATLLAACVPVPTPATPTQAPAQQPTQAPTAAPVTQAAISDIVWQWTSVTDQTTKTTQTVPAPENYTIIFSADGTLTGKADCNNFAGTYAQENGLTIKLGPSTMAYCGEASLDTAYLQLLSAVAAGGPDGAGNLALETAGGAQRLLFRNGGAPEATTSPITQPGMIQPQQVSINTQGLPYSWQANLVPATPYDASQPPGPKGLPEHIEVNFGVTDPADKQSDDPILYIIPVMAYEHMWDSAANPYVSGTVSRIYSWTVALQTPPPTSDLPALPPEQVSGYNDLAVQIGRAATDATSASKSGYRFVGRWAQDANPVTAESRLWYTYQGFTNDGQYLVFFFYPVTTARLPKQAELTGAEMDKFNSDPQAYIKAQAEMLNALAPTDWQPDLTQLDKLAGSLQIQGMPQSGLHDVVWQWTGSTYDGKEHPIADPAQYEVIYGSDGTLSVKADCNQARGTYTYNGGMVGNVRVTMGPTTLAACGPDSRSVALTNSLMAAQDYRMQPGGGEMDLNMPAGGPVLRFKGAGPAPKP
jgi:heat shock protein HslJ